MEPKEKKQNKTEEFNEANEKAALDSHYFLWIF